MEMRRIRFAIGAAMATLIIAFMSSLISFLIVPKQPTPPLEDRISRAVEGLEDTGALVTELEAEVGRLRKVNEELTQEQLNLESWIRVKEHQYTLRPYFETLAERSAWERRILTALSIFAGWLLGVATPKLSKVMRRAQPRS